MYKRQHLVWTLVDPLACFREWHRVLKPGGSLIIIDGDFVNQSLIARLASRCAAWIASRTSCLLYTSRCV